MGPDPPSRQGLPLNTMEATQLLQENPGRKEQLVPIERVKAQMRKACVELVTRVPIGQVKY